MLEVYHKADKKQLIYNNSIVNNDIHDQDVMKLKQIKIIFNNNICTFMHTWDRHN